MWRVSKNNFFVVLDLSKFVDDIQNNSCSSNSSNSTRSHEVIENLKVKMKAYAKTTKATLIYFYQKQEIKKSNHIARRKNGRILYLLQIENE